jgi:hypothetical protein
MTVKELILELLEHPLGCEILVLNTEQDAGQPGAELAISCVLDPRPSQRYTMIEVWREA